MLACVHAVPRYLYFATSRGAPFRSHAASASRRRCAAPAPRQEKALCPPTWSGTEGLCCPRRSARRAPHFGIQPEHHRPIHETRGGTPPPRSPPPSTADGFSGHAATLGEAPCGSEEARFSPRGARRGHLVRGHSVLFSRSGVPRFGDAPWSLSRHRFSRARAPRPRAAQ